jgi:4-aminobutyrate aminotransferase-like enzyme
MGTHDGPESRTNAYWLELDKKYRIVSRPPAPYVLERGEGIYIYDVEGNQFIDCESGQVCVGVGHCHPAIKEAAIAQMGKIMQTGLQFTNIPSILLGEKLATLSPGNLNKSYFANGGGEANEAALRMAKKATGRYEVVSLVGAYHGRGGGAASISTRPAGGRKGYGPVLPGTLGVPACDIYRCPFEGCKGGCNLACVDYAEDLINRCAGEPAVFFIEAMSVGDAGMRFPTKEWVQRIRELCTRRGILMAVDECVTGIGRTGEWFAMQYHGVVPDILTCSKMLGGGVPLSAVLVTEELGKTLEEKGYVEGSSHSFDPFVCAVGLANIEVMEQEAMLENAKKQGEFILNSLQAMALEHEWMGYVDGRGLLIGVEIVEDSGSKTPAPSIAAKWTKECLKREVSLGAAYYGAHIRRIAPPLIITREQSEILVQAMADAAKAV